MENKEKIVAFAGHRYEWHSIGVEDKLPSILEDLIAKGYTIFYDGGYGAFDKKCANAVFNLKKKYPQIKIYKILTYYHHDKEKYEISSTYDGSIYPDIEVVHFKQKIIKLNEWIVDQCDILVCHIEETYKSGAYKTLKYAQKQNKPIINI